MLHEAMCVPYYQQSAVNTSKFCYTWDAVTSLNLNVSMVKNLRRHLVCTTDSLHEQAWWILMRSSCERQDICFSIKSSLWALTAAYTKFRRMIWSMI